jgi:hypothetical protein
MGMSHFQQSRNVSSNGLPLWHFELRLGIPCFALSEKLFGTGAGKEDFRAILLGTGVSASIVTKCIKCCSSCVTARASLRSLMIAAAILLPTLPRFL